MSETSLQEQLLKELILMLLHLAVKLFKFDCESTNQTPSLHCDTLCHSIFTSYSL